MLLKENFYVKVFDTFWYGDGFFRELNHKNLELIKADVRDIASVSRALKNTTDVIHLACISNDPSFDLNPALGRSINFESFAPLVRAAKKNGVSNFIYASSSSVYGVKEEEKVTEELKLEPLTDYSKFKMYCEDILLTELSSNFNCTVLRPATICGVSPRQRFDLSVNILTNHAINKREINVFGGTQFRPNLHIDDMSRAYIHVLNQNENVSGEIFNVGGENLSLDQIAQRVKLNLNIKLEILHKSTDDLRSYRVDSSKFFNLTGFSVKHSIDHAINDLSKAFRQSKFLDPLNNSFYYNIRRMKELSLG
jgi:nucleoside-diphosphate-sugar epimerase